MASSPLELRRARPLLGTLVDIRVVCGSEVDGARALEAAFAEIADVHALMSYQERGSDLDRLNGARPGEWVEVDARTMEVLDCAAALHADSAGAFDVAVADALVTCG